MEAYITSDLLKRLNVLSEKITRKDYQKIFACNYKLREGCLRRQGVYLLHFHVKSIMPVSALFHGFTYQLLFSLEQYSRVIEFGANSFICVKGILHQKETVT